MKRIEDIVGKIHCCDCLDFMREMPDGCIDLILTDPPYAINFMQKQWDKALPPVEVWRECLRVLKPGGWCFVMSAPRQDVLSRMMVNLEDAGFKTDFSSIYWTYASGFPKAQNISKAVDKRMGAEREVVGKGRAGLEKNSPAHDGGFKSEDNITAPATPEAKALDGSYAGFQPKPAVEVVIVCMKSLSEKTYLDQALKDGKGITWLDDCKIPTEKETRRAKSGWQEDGYVGGEYDSEKYNALKTRQPSGRFPANLLVSDDVLNDGKKHTSGDLTGQLGTDGDVYGKYKRETPLYLKGNNVSSFSRYFSLDAWDEGARKTFPFLIVPKPSKAEKNRGLEGSQPQRHADRKKDDGVGGDNPRNRTNKAKVNFHPTVKPLKLMRYLVTMATRPGDIVCDPYAGSGTTLVAAKGLERKFIGIELSPEYCDIAQKRVDAVMNQTKLNLETE